LALRLKFGGEEKLCIGPVPRTFVVHWLNPYLNTTMASGGKAGTGVRAKTTDYLPVSHFIAKHFFPAQLP